MKHKEWTALQGRRLAEARKKSGYTQERAAAEGLFLSTHTQISNWENGKGDPSLSQIWTLCNMYGCDLGYILGEPGYENGTRVKTDIAAQTGLPAPAVEHLQEIREKNIYFARLALAELLTEKGLLTLHEIGQYLQFRFKDMALERSDGYSVTGEELAEVYFLNIHKGLSAMRDTVQKGHGATLPAIENGAVVWNPDLDRHFLPVDSGTDRKIMEQIEARYWAGKDKGAQNG